MDKNANKAMLMEDAEESVNELFITSLMRSVIGIAADDAEMSKYAVTCTIDQEIVFRILLLRKS